jgi:hypothetical protein
MKLGKLLARVIFVWIFVGAILYYQPSLPTFEIGILCPVCPYIDRMGSDVLGWLYVGLIAGLIFGLTLGLAGFIFGLVISWCAARFANPPEK